MTSRPCGAAQGRGAARHPQPLSAGTRPARDWSDSQPLPVPRGDGERVAPALLAPGRTGAQPRDLRPRPRLGCGPTLRPSQVQKLPTPQTPRAATSPGDSRRSPRVPKGWIGSKGEAFDVPTRLVPPLSGGPRGGGPRLVSRRRGRVWGPPVNAGEALLFVEPRPNP